MRQVRASTRSGVQKEFSNIFIPPCWSATGMIIVCISLFISRRLDVLVYALQKWITMRTISGQPKYLDECLRGAKFLKSVLKQLGAESTLVRRRFGFVLYLIMPPNLLFRTRSLAPLVAILWCLASSLPTQAPTQAPVTMTTAPSRPSKSSSMGIMTLSL